MAFAPYVYTRDNGVDYTVYVPDDFASALGMIAATTQPPLPSQVGPRYASFSGSDGSFRQAVIQDTLTFSTIIGATFTVDAVAFSAFSAQGETTPPLQTVPLNGAALIQGPIGAQGPTGATGPAGPTGPAGTTAQLISDTYNTIEITSDVVPLMIKGLDPPGSVDLLEVRRGSDGYPGFRVYNDSMITQVWGLVTDSTVTHYSVVQFGDLAECYSKLCFITPAGRLQFPSGADSTVGSGTLSGGTVTIANYSIDVYSRVRVWSTQTGSLANAGVLVASNYVPGVGFDVNSSNPLDDSDFMYEIINVV